MFYDVQYGQIQQILDIKFVHLLKLSFFVATYYCVDLARGNGALSIWTYTHFGSHVYLKNVIIFNSIYLSFDRRHCPHTIRTMHPIKDIMALNVGLQTPSLFLQIRTLVMTDHNISLSDKNHTLTVFYSTLFFPLYIQQACRTINVFNYKVPFNNTPPVIMFIYVNHPELLFYPWSQVSTQLNVVVMLCRTLD